jgi:class 3 adenylate cyclase/CHASE2 domain-containing sensor protein
MADEPERVYWTSPWPLNAALCACVAGIVLIAGNPLETQEHQWFGQLLRWRFAAGWAPPVDRSILQFYIDQEDLEHLHTLEEEYAAAARIIRETSELGARVIVFDVVFARGDAQAAQPLIEALIEHKNVVLAEVESPLPGAAVGSLRVRSFPFREPLDVPYGLINVAADSDGVIRHYDLIKSSESAPSLALAAYLASLGLDKKNDITFPSSRSVEWRELSRADFVTMIPRRAPAGPVLLNFRCPWSVESAPQAFKFMNLRELDALYLSRRENLDTKPLDNKVVIVGYVATGQADLAPTIFGPHEPLAYVHSTALNDLMQSRWIQRTGPTIDALWVCSALALAAIARFSVSKRWLVLFWFLSIACLVAVGIALLFQCHVLVPMVATVSLWSVGLVCELARRHSWELYLRLRQHWTMSFYFSPRVLPRVLKNPGSMLPQEVEITVLLTDLRNSTPLAELLKPHRIFEFLNRVFEIETTAVMAQDGTLEHFLGDQFLAYWGAPDPQKDKAERALRAALALIDAMEKLHANLPPNEKELFGYGVALHSGRALIGNKGSTRRMDYGVVGDLINTAARVESLTKYYEVLFLVTREVFEELSNPPVFRILDRVIVKGKSTTVELIELQHPRSPASFAKLAIDYHEAFAHYEHGNFAEAARLFDVHAGYDRPSALLAERCRVFQASPPLEWLGVFKMDTK